MIQIHPKYIAVIVLLLSFISCKRDEAVINLAESNYPNDVGKIILTKCATSGCHNNQSKDAAAGLSLETWNRLFEGSRGGATLIPYRPDFSTFCYYTNTFPELGLTLSPTMPYDKKPLSKEEYLLLRNWILNGAPDKNGFVKFSDNPNRKKFYITNQGCDVVTVFDQETGFPMRYIDVGKSAINESPHMIRVSPDKQYWYVILRTGGVLQKFRTTDDSYVGEIKLGQYDWNTFVITPDSKKAFCVDWSANGQIKYVDLINLTVLMTYSGNNLLVYPHGSTINKAGTILYVTSQTGNYIYKIDVSDPYAPNIEEKILETEQPKSQTSLLDPHEILLSPDGSKYFVTCQQSNEVRILQTSNDSLLAIIPVGSKPQEMSLSTSTNYLFVSCMEDTVTFSGKRGSIAVINYATNAFVKMIDCGYQPHGLAVDDNKKLVYVANRNFNPNGPAPHHASNCGGRNGNVVFIDMNTLSLVPGKKIEIAADPYSIAVKP